MEYSEILNVLPKDVSQILQTKLDRIQLTPELTKEEVEELINDAVKLTKLEILIDDDEKLRLVDKMLSFVAKAAVNAIFA